MAYRSEDLNGAVAELDDGYVTVLLLLAIRRASSEEPRRAGFWHALAGVLAAELEKRRGAAQFRRDDPLAIKPEPGELEAVVAGFRRDLETLEAEYRESYGDLATPGSETPA